METIAATENIGQVVASLGIGSLIGAFIGAWLKDLFDSRRTEHNRRRDARQALRLIVGTISAFEEVAKHLIDQQHNLPRRKIYSLHKMLRNFDLSILQSEIKNSISLTTHDLAQSYDSQKFPEILLRLLCSCVSIARTKLEETDESMPNGGNSLAITQDDIGIFEEFFRVFEEFSTYVEEVYAPSLGLSDLSMITNLKNIDWKYNLDMRRLSRLSESLRHLQALTK